MPQLGWNRSWLGLLRARNDRLDPEQRSRLARLLSDNPVLAPIYEMKERLWALLRHKGLSKASCRRHIRELFTLIGPARQRL